MNFLKAVRPPKKVSGPYACRRGESRPLYLSRHAIAVATFGT
jgi:hypothetical protein